MKRLLKHGLILGALGTVVGLVACGSGGSGEASSAGASGIGTGGSSAGGSKAGSGGSAAGTGGGVSGSGGTGGQQPAAGALGALCSKNGDCDSGVCQTNGHCTAPCTSKNDCPDGPAWTCAPMTGHEQQCQCQAGAETCDGVDNDCDGIADVGAICAQPGYTCINKACACTDKCNDACTNLQTDAKNCGSCGKLCGAGQVCQSGQCVVGPCNGKCGPLEDCFQDQLCVAKLVAVTGGYSIDATEVTRAQYAAWLSKTPPTGGQATYCTWNTDYTPNCEWPAGAKGGHPVVCVDWCDAYAYCAGVGKRLCGQIGGGTNALGDYANASRSQWYNACSGGGQNEYPYGNAYSDHACNTKDNAVGSTLETGSLNTCQTSAAGYAGVYDLGGNVWEWEDSCSASSGNTGESAGYCHIRGGSFYGIYGDTGRCDVDNAKNRALYAEYFGFRCCAP